VEVTNMTIEGNDEIRSQVQEHYGAVARTGASCCAPGCCGGAATSPGPAETALRLGYSTQDLGSVPDGANLGLGCGNPGAIAALRAGETVLDLGSGAGFDCFLAARQVGPTGRVIGVDMTPNMIRRARENATKVGLGNVEFRLGEIERMPVADQTVDAVISNCVVNLSPDKPAVFAEAMRVLRPGGRLAINDVVALRPVPEEIRRDLTLYTGCVAGAATIPETEAMLRQVGFVDVQVELNDAASKAMTEMIPGDLDLSTLAASARITARRSSGSTGA
jgi:arsenite methyltransferase